MPKPPSVTIKSATAQNWPTEEFRNKGASSRKEALHFSLAGVQLKFSAVMGARGGLTIPAEGVGGSWIVKLPSTSFDNVPENEFSMMTLARLMGMNVPDVKLVPLAKISGLPENIGKLHGQALAVRRFDRTSSGPVHMEDLAQVFGVYPDEKYKKGSYKNIAQVLWSETGENGVKEFIRRLVFNTLIGNADMHLKNWSLIYPDQCTAELSPGYDFVSTIAYISDENMALNYVKSKRMAGLSLEELSYFATKAGLPEKMVLDTAKETVKKFKMVWKRERKNLSLASSIVSTIEKHAKAIRLSGEVT